MQSFIYNTPTKIIFGIDAETHIAEELTRLKVKKVLLHYGSDRIKNNGLFSKVVDQLDKADIEYIELGGVQPNPKIELVREGVELCKQNDVDFILAIGGGSVVDSSKAMAIGLATGLDPWKVITDHIVPKDEFKIGVVLTIAAAGSEMSSSVVITDPERNLKRSTSLETIRPAIAFMNPQNTVSVSPFQTAAGSVDILMHTMERYLTDEAPTPLTDALAEGLVRCVIEQTNRVLANPEDIDARAEIMWASSLSHNGLTGCGRSMTFTAHKIEHDLSGFKDEITHGAGLAVVFPAWCEYERKRRIERFYTWAKNMWGVDKDGLCAGDEEKMDEAILEGIQTMKETFKSWNMPQNLDDLGIKPADYDTVIALTTENNTRQIPSFGRFIGADEIREIYSLME